MQYPKWTSRKFVMAALAALVAFGNGMGWWEGMTAEQIWLILLPLLTYIGVEGIADIKER